MIKQTLVSLAALLGTVLTTGSAMAADKVDMQIALGTPVIEADSTQRVFLKISLTGFEQDIVTDRTPANVAIVLDKSGSMSGTKIEQAREAAIKAIDLLNRSDYVSVIAYDSTVEVIVPATRVKDKSEIRESVRHIRAGGNTALFAGVSKGASQVRKYLDEQRVNRVILLSDGQANVGPSSVSELGDLGRSLAREGISVTTIGLGTGYNEDLMTALAGYSDGNHAFVRNASELEKIFQYEFGDVLSVVAQDVEITIYCNDGVRPIRLLGREAEIRGQKIVTRLNQLYSEQEKYLVVELEVPPGSENETRNLASVDLRYRNMQSKSDDILKDSVSVAFTKSQAEVRKAAEPSVLTSSYKQIANEASKEALKLRDEGKAEAAGRLLLEQAAELQAQSAQYGGIAELEEFSSEIAKDAEEISDRDTQWNEKRKSLRAKQYKLDRQQSY